MKILFEVRTDEATQSRYLPVLANYTVLNSDAQEVFGAMVLNEHGQQIYAAFDTMPWIYEDVSGLVRDALN